MLLNICRITIWIGGVFLLPALLKAETPTASGPAKSAAQTVVVDVLGNAHSIDTPPKRIVSTCLPCDEIILGILQQPGLNGPDLAGTGNRLIAVSKIAEDHKYSNVVAAAKAIPHRAGSEIEGVIALKPDLVFINEFNRPEFRAALKKANVHTFALGPFGSLKDILAAIETTGVVLGEPAAAARVKSQFLIAIEEIKQRIPRSIRNTPTSAPKLLSFSPDGTIAGADTPFDSIVRAAGGVNLAAQKNLSGWGDLLWMPQARSTQLDSLAKW